MNDIDYVQMVPVVGISVRGTEERSISEEVVFPFRTTCSGHVRRSLSVAHLLSSLQSGIFIDFTRPPCNRRDFQRDTCLTAIWR